MASLSDACCLLHHKLCWQELHKHLTFLKHFDGDMDALCLDFTTSESELGSQARLLLS
jgi:hypothetical protein